MLPLSLQGARAFNFSKCESMDSKEFSFYTGPYVLVIQGTQCYGDILLMRMLDTKALRNKIFILNCNFIKLARLLNTIKCVFIPNTKITVTLPIVWIIVLDYKQIISMYKVPNSLHCLFIRLLSNKKLESTLTSKNSSRDNHMHRQWQVDPFHWSRVFLSL